VHNQRKHRKQLASGRSVSPGLLDALYKLEEERKS
jgi:hypothetical protein